MSFKDLLVFFFRKKKKRKDFHFLRYSVNLFGSNQLDWNWEQLRDQILAAVRQTSSEQCQLLEWSMFDVMLAMLQITNYLSNSIFIK